MRKQELVHLHGLLVEIRRHFVEQDEIQIPADAFEAYDEYGVGPTAIPERKDAHKAAVHHLLEGLETTVPTQQPAGEPASTPSDVIEASPSR